MRTIGWGFLFFIGACSGGNQSEETHSEKEGTKTEVKEEKQETEGKKLERLLTQIKTDVGDVKELMRHTRFVLSPDCSFLMLFEEEKPFYEEADFEKYYPKIFTKEVIEKLQGIKTHEVEIKRDGSGQMIGFMITLNFSEYIPEAGVNDEWALILDFVVENDTYTLFCMRGAG